MKDWFASLQQREQYVLIAGAIIVPLTLAYMFLVEPIMEGSERAQSDISRKTALLAAASRVSPTGASTNVGSTNPASSLTLIIANTVRAANLETAYKNSAPTNTGGLRVAFENASFDEVVAWLATIDSQHNISVESGSFTRRREVGRVDASMTLQRAR